MIEEADGLLLVCNKRRDGSCDWSPPGGVIDPREDVLVGLTREVREETGLVVESWSPAIYSVHIDAPGMGWQLDATVHRAEVWSGSLVLEDPDGIVVDADFVLAAQCGERMSGAHPWVGEPLAEWIVERWDDPKAFGYLLEGTDRASAHLVRLPPG